MAFVCGVRLWRAPANPMDVIDRRIVPPGARYSTFPDLRAISPGLDDRILEQIEISWRPPPNKSRAFSMSSFILVIDQGTTSSRALIFDHEGNVVSHYAQTFQQYFPRPSWVEHDPIEIWTSCQTCLHKALAAAKLKLSDICAIGITNQRETAVVWDRHTGCPIHNAIVWQDRRTSAFMDSLEAESDWIRTTTGLPLDAYFSASKFKWILDTVPGARASAQNESLVAAPSRMFCGNSTWYCRRDLSGLRD